MQLIEITILNSQIDNLKTNNKNQLTIINELENNNKSDKLNASKY